MNDLVQKVHDLEHRVEELTYALADMQKSHNRLVFKDTLDAAQQALPHLSLKLDVHPDSGCVLRVKVVTENGQRLMLAEQVKVEANEDGTVTYNYIEATLNSDVANLIDAAMLYNTMNYPDTWIYITAYDTSKADQDGSA